MKRSRLSFTAANAVGLPLRGERGAARQALREHLHLGRGRRGGAVPASRCRPSRNIMSAAKTKNVSAMTPEDLELLERSGRWPISGSLRGIRISDVAVRSCSMIDTDASGS